jgi:hypothetical protein
MCSIEKDPFAFNFTHEHEQNDPFNRYDIKGAGKFDSNLDGDELLLYILVISFSTLQFILIIRYFLRLQRYFDRLQEQIKKQIDSQPRKKKSAQHVE